MAAVSLSRTFINSGSDSRSFYTAQLLVDNPAARVEVRTYAQGRRRIITRPGRSRSIDVGLRLVSAADLAWLESRAGTVVLLRDVMGRKMWSVYAEVRSTPYSDRSAFDVALSFTEVTYDESV